MGRLQFIGRNVDIEGGGEINPGVELLEGHSPPLMRECRREINKAIVQHRRRGLICRKGIKLIGDFFTEYMCFKGDKPTKKFIDFMYKRENFIVEKWDRLGLMQIVPVNREIINRALRNIPKSPARACNYRLEMVLAAIRTEKHIAKIRGEEKRGCNLCGCRDSLEHTILFSAHAQIAWLVSLRAIKFSTGIDIKLNASMIFMGSLGGGNQC